VLRLIDTADVYRSLPIPVTLMIKTIRSLETSVLARATQCNIPGDGNLHNRRRENLKSCTIYEKIS
jgi:hypothetical protein